MHFQPFFDTAMWWRVTRYWRRLQLSGKFDPAFASKNVRAIAFFDDALQVAGLRNGKECQSDTESPASTAQWRFTLAEPLILP